MKRFVVDASIAAKWFFLEEYSQDAIKIMNSKRILMAPDFMWIEVGNVCWKRIQRNEIQEHQAQEMLRNLLRYPLEVYPAKPLLGPALSIASQLKISIYDALYVSLAYSKDAVLVTADRKLFQSINKKPYLAHIAWIEDV